MERIIDTRATTESGLNIIKVSIEENCVNLDEIGIFLHIFCYHIQLEYALINSMKFLSEESNASFAIFQYSSAFYYCISYGLRNTKWDRYHCGRL